MSCGTGSPNINKTFIIEPLSTTGGSPTLSACTTMYTNLLQSCSGDTTIQLGTGNVTFNSNVTGVSGFTANTVEANIFTSGGTNLIDIFGGLDTFVTGGTFSDVGDSLALTRNDGANVIITGITNFFTTGGTFIDDTIYFDRNDQLSAFTVDLSTLDLNDTFITGGSYNSNTDIITLTRNDGVNINVTGITDTVSTGGTFNDVGDTLTINKSDNTSFTITGLTNFFTTGTTLIGSTLHFHRNDALSAYTANLSSLDVNDTFVTGATFSANTLTLTRNDAVNIDVNIDDVQFSGGSGSCIADLYVTNIHGCSPINVIDNINFSGTARFGSTVYLLPTPINDNSLTSLLARATDGSIQTRSVNSILSGTSADTFVTGFTYDGSNNFRLGLNDGTSFSANISEVSGLTVNGTLSATTLSGGTIYGNGENITGIKLSQILSGHTHPISEIINLQTELDSKFDKSGGTVTGSVLITGDVTILGTATTINTETLTVEDNIITINSNATGTTLPLPIDSGIEVLRNSATTASLLWEESNGYWAAGLSGDTKRIILSGDSLSLLNSGHTHPIGEIVGLQSALDAKTDLSLFNAHTADTSNPHQVAFSSLTTTAHTHSISDVTNLQTELDSKFDKSGGTITGSLSATTISANTFHGSGEFLTGIDNFYTTGGTQVDNTLYFDRTDALSAYSVNISTVFTGNTAGSCIDDIFVSNLHGCTGLTVHSPFQSLSSTATTLYSIAFGERALASGDDSSAFGLDTIASGDESTAFGTRSQALGTAAFAGGRDTIASGKCSTTFGDDNIAGGDASFTVGSSTRAMGTNSFAQGFDTDALGFRSHAGGQSSMAVGINSFVHGRSSTVNGDDSAILAGSGNTLASTALRSVILGGGAISGGVSDMVYVPNLNIDTTPTLDNSLTQILVRDGNGFVKYRDVNSISGAITADTFTTGATLIGSKAYFDRNDILSAYTLDLSSFSSDDFYSTGGTYNELTDIITITRNDGVSFNITGVTDTFSTGTTFGSNQAIITRNDAFDVFKLSGGSNVTLTNPSTNLIKIDVAIPADQNTFVTGGTHNNNNTIILTRNDAVNIPISGVASSLLFNTHTGDTTIHYTKSSINLSDLGSSAHTHPIGEIVGLQTALDTKVEGATNIGGGNEIFSGKSGTTLMFRTLSGGSNTSITQIGDVQRIDVSVPVDTNTYVTAATWNQLTNVLTITRNDGTAFTPTIEIFNGFQSSATTGIINTGTFTTSNKVAFEVSNNAIRPVEVNTLYGSQISASHSGIDINAIGGYFYADADVGGTATGLFIEATGGANNYGLKLQDGSQAAGRFLKSVDANGNANWAQIGVGDITGLTDNNTFVTGGTITGGTTLVYTRNDGANLPVNLSSFLDNTNYYVTGGTYNPSTDVITFTNNTGGTFNVTGVTDTFSTGTTFGSNQAIITRNDGTEIFKLSGGSNVTLSNPSANQIKVDVNIPSDQNTFVTGGTVSTGGTLDLTRNDDVTVPVDLKGLKRYTVTADKALAISAGRSYLTNTGASTLSFGGNNPDNDEAAFNFQVPSDYISGGTFYLKFMTTATILNVTFNMNITSRDNGGDMSTATDTGITGATAGSASSWDMVETAAYVPISSTFSADKNVAVKINRDASVPEDTFNNGTAYVWGLVFEYSGIK